MKIAELFVNLGIKGADKTVGALTTVRGKFSEITSTSLETKAAILGVMYGLERLMSQSAQTGTSLVQFANFTGLSTDKLQRWQYLALQSGEAADEMAGNIQSVQQAMTKMIVEGKPPAGINQLMNVVGFDINRARDTFYVMDKLREYARATKNIPDVSNQILQSFGLSDKTVQALRTSRVNLDKIDPSRLYSDNQQKRLNQVDIGFRNIKDKFEHGFGRLTSQFGPGMVKDIDKLSTAVLRLMDSFGKLNQQLHFTAGIGKVFEGWTSIFSTVSDLLDPKKRAELFNDASILGKSLITPTPSVVGSSNKQVTNNVHANVTVHGVQNAHEVPQHINKVINDAARQFPNPGF